MGEKDFLEKLLEYDKDNIPDIVIAKIRSSFLTDPDFKPQRVK
jgi:dynein heavy chain